MRDIRRSRMKWGVSAAALSVTLVAATAGLANEAQNSDAAALVNTQSPLKHVIILIGENRGTDHTFGVYKPKGRGQTISNILSKGIVNEDGSPGPNFSEAQQFSVKAQQLFYIGAPKKAKTAYSANGQMPQPNTNGAPIAQGTTGAPFTPAFLALATTLDLSPDFTPNTDTILTTGFTGLPANSLDTRVPNAGILPNGPFILQGPHLSDDDHTV